MSDPIAVYDNRPDVRTHTCISCFGTFTSARAAHACHGGSACPFDEPDMWEHYEPDPVATWDDLP